MQRLLRHLMNMANVCLLQDKVYIAVLIFLPTDNCHYWFLFT